MQDDKCDGCNGKLFLDEATRLPDGKLVCEGCHEAHLEDKAHQEGRFP